MLSRILPNQIVIYFRRRFSYSLIKDSFSVREKIRVYFEDQVQLVLCILVRLGGRQHHHTWAETDSYILMTKHTRQRSVVIDSRTQIHCFYIAYTDCKIIVSLLGRNVQNNQHNVSIPAEQVSCQMVLLHCDDHPWVRHLGTSQYPHSLPVTTIIRQQSDPKVTGH